MASAIDCYTCASIAGSDRRCEDPVFKEFLNYSNDCQVRKIHFSANNSQLTNFISYLKVPLKISVYGSLKSDFYPGMIATESATHCVKTIGVTRKISTIVNFRKFVYQNL